MFAGAFQFRPLAAAAAALLRTAAQAVTIDVVPVGNAGNDPDTEILWYDWTKWVLERVDHFPKNQRFIFGQRKSKRRSKIP